MLGAAHALVRLDLYSNGLRRVPALAGAAGARLTALDLVGNNIARLPWELLRLTRLRELKLCLNPALAAVHALQGECNGHGTHCPACAAAPVLAYLRDLYGAEPVERRALKLVLTGPTMAGKTSLLRALRDDEARARRAPSLALRSDGLSARPPPRHQTVRPIARPRLDCDVLVCSCAGAPGGRRHGAHHRTGRAVPGEGRAPSL